jgi:ribosome-associated protein
MKTSNNTYAGKGNNSKNEEADYDGPSKSQLKRDSHHLIDVGEEILKLSHEDILSMDLPDELKEAVDTALKIKSRSGLKRQRLYIGKLLRSLDSEQIEIKLKQIQHRHDTNTALFKRLEKWRDNLIGNDKQTLDEVISRHPEIDRQHINQLIRAANQEQQRNKPPAASRKLFKYLGELEDGKEQ